MQYAVGIAVIVVIVLVAVAGFQLSFEEPTVQEQRVDIVHKISEDSVAKLRIAGPVVAQEAHRVIEIAVSPEFRRVKVLEGYQGDSEVVRRRTYSNSRSAFRNFIAALDTADFAAAVPATVDKMGACPQGKRYTYTLINGGTAVINLWGTSCGDDLGSFAGDDSLAQDLFKDQIPDYDEVTEDVSF